MVQSPKLKSAAKQPAAEISSSIPTSFPAKPISTIKLPGLQAALQKVASARGRFHVQKIAILVRWENDDTGAEEYEEFVENMQSLCEEVLIAGATLLDPFRPMTLSAWLFISCIYDPSYLTFDQSDQMKTGPLVSVLSDGAYNVNIVCQWGGD